MKVKSSKEPDVFKIRTSNLEDKTNISVLARWNIQQNTVEGIDGETSTEYEYNEELIRIYLDESMTEPEIEDYLNNNEQKLLEKAKQKHSRKINNEKKEIDKDTGETISARVHSKAKEKEEIAILRNQIVSMVNELGLKTTEDFKKLNKIAREEIQRGINKKEDL